LAQALWRRPDPRHKLDHDAVWVGNLEVALAPWLGLDWGRELDSLGLEPRVFGVHVIDDEYEKQAVGVATTGDAPV
jgi:hypothetical protein